MLRLPSTPVNADDDCLISVVEDFSPPPKFLPPDFTVESDRDEALSESGWSYLFGLFAKAGSAASEGDTQVHPCNGADAH